MSDNTEVIQNEVVDNSETEETETETTDPVDTPEVDEEDQDEEDQDEEDQDDTITPGFTDPDILPEGLEVDSFPITPPAEFPSLDNTESLAYVAAVHIDRLAENPYDMRDSEDGEEDDEEADV